MPVTVEKEPLQPGSSFAFIFMLTVLSVAGVMLQLPDSGLKAWRDLTIRITQVVGALLGVSTTGNADVLTVNGFAMRIINDCTAVNYVVILATAILLYRRHSVSYRLLGIAVAVPAVILLNACRLLMSGLVGTLSRSAFDFVHDYLWVVAFALLVFAIWSLWVNGRFVVRRPHLRRIALVAVISLATYALLAACHELYGDLLARLSSFFYRWFGNDPGAAIIREGDVMMYSHAGEKICLNTVLDQVNIAVYAGLMIPQQKRGDWEMAGMTVAGLAVIVVMSSMFIAVGCVHAVTSGALGLLAFLHISTMVDLALPMALYWMMAGQRERDRFARRGAGVRGEEVAG